MLGRAREHLSAPLYPLLPQFFAEQRERSVTWLPRATRYRMRMHVRDGLIMAPPERIDEATEGADDGGAASGGELGGELGDDGELRPLGHNVEGAALAIFVMDTSGELLLTCDHAPNRFHHSSFVAGAPVIAAGEMRVHRGKLVAITNRSGHYAPPPSCLHLVMQRLKALGVGSLHDVKVEPVEPPAMIAGER
jgi:hypothetical protein